MMSPAQTLVGILGMAAVTILTRGFFLLSEREWPVPAALMRGLRYAPLAALAAIIAPEVLLTNGSLVDHWQDARLLAVAAGTAYFWWQRSILGTIVVGTAVMLAAKLGLGW
jgi:branched-subunit amino acid transport protein